jgi:hypothetical protein
MHVFSIQDNLRKSAEAAFKNTESFVSWYVSANRHLLTQYPAIPKGARKALTTQAWKEAAKRQEIVQLAAFRD